MRILNVLKEALDLKCVDYKVKKNLQEVINRTKKIKKNDVILVGCLRNENVRAPYFCEYYRELGVNHFLFIDNGSTDGFIEWAGTQADISVWYTDANYKTSNFGMDWCNYLLKIFGSNHLCVTVDLDEFLVYPFCETRPLKALGQHLLDARRDSMPVLLLDMYNVEGLRQANIASGEDPLSICQYFDGDGYIQKRSPYKGTFIQGGPRMRVYNSLKPELSPALNKIPVVWWKKNYRYESSTHHMKPYKLNKTDEGGAPVTTGCLLHFKFTLQLIDKSIEERERGQHYSGGREYASYREHNNKSLFHPDISQKYIGTEQLIRFGLMNRGDWF